MIGASGSERGQCPKKVARMADIFANRPDVDPLDVLTGHLRALPGQVACDCPEGPQPRTVLGHNLPKFCGQVCGKMVEIG